MVCYTGYGAYLDDGGEPAKLQHHLVCVDRKTGKILFDETVPGAREKKAPRMQLTEHGFASPTPATDGKGIYAYFGTAGVVAFYDEAIELAPPESKAGLAVYKGFTNIHGGNIPAAIDELETLADDVESMGTPADQVKGLQVFALSSGAFAAMHAGLFERAEAIVSRRNELQMAIAEDVGTDDARRLQKANCQFFDGLLAAFKGDAEGAAEHAKAVTLLVEGDENPRKLEGANWVLGKSALQTGDFASAVDHLRQADHANNIFVRYHLAIAEEGNGNVEKARKLFDEVAIFNFNSVGFALIGREAATRTD